MAELVDREDLFTVNNPSNGEYIGTNRPKSSNGDSNPSEPPTRVHYSESTTEVQVPGHIIQVRFDKQKTDESSIRALAAARVNAELRADTKNSLLIFQSKKAAENALQNNPFKDATSVILEKWCPAFFPTSMF